MGGELLGDGQQVQQAISWNHFALLLTACLFALQQMGLYYFISRYSLSLLSLAAVDLVLLLLLLQSSSSEYAATEGGTCWVVYAWSLSIKYLLFFFAVYSGGGPQGGLLFGGPAGGVLEVGLLFSLSAWVYALLAFRAAAALFGGISHYSLDSMLHTDAATHVVFDILDGVAAFHTFALLPAAVKQQNGWLHVLAGILVPVALFLHGYSFPAVGGGGGGPPGAPAGGPLRRAGAPAGAAGAGPQQQPPGGPWGPAQGAPNSFSGDVQTMRKHAAIVGMFFVDLPLLGLRLFMWAYYPTYEGFSPFMFKNICFIPIQLTRLRQCAGAERSRVQFEEEGGPLEGAPPSYGGRGASRRGPPVPRSAAAVVALEDLAAAEELLLSPREEAAAAAARRRKTNRYFGAPLLQQRRDTGAPYYPLKTAGQPEGAPDSDSNPAQQQQQQQQQQQRKLTSSAEGAFKGIVFWRRQQNKEPTAAESNEDSLTDYDASLSRLVAVCQSATEAARRLPAKGFTAKRVFQKLLYSFR
ncbi:hypothetical protein, conserved, partial [Eimeria tenella]